MSDILERLRGYNPLDRTSDNIQAAKDISDAADAIEHLTARLATAEEAARYMWDIHFSDLPKGKEIVARWPWLVEAAKGGE